MLCNIRKDVREAYGSRNNDIVDIGVSYDGSWLTRGHTSNIGIGCVIDLLTGFVIDFEVMSKRCEECQQTKLALGEDTAEFHFWYEGHRDFCSITHVGSSGSMEVKAAIKLWERSESIGFRYTSLLSDGDSKAFSELNERKIYGSQVEIKKEECINHVSKRLGTALRKTVKDWRVKGVTLGGKKHGSLKEETIKKLTRYYANAVRRNKGDIEAMKTAIYATLFHSISTDKKPQHKKCPSGEDSWCFYQSALARGKKPGAHKDWVKTPINEKHLCKILPIYQWLASTDLLSRCVRGLTQNSNEALHSMIWNKCFKENSASRNRVLIAVSNAISEYNVGTLKTLETFQSINCLPTSSASKHLANFTDYRRTYFRNKIKSVKYKVAQQKIKQAKLRRLKTEKKLEGITYKAGYF
ncbi:hypothetical protein AVEN_167517-1 [Araneus ventricosus]|uniref:Mutator-like transposase domain-containing protein n=1 Tax=Araneus ventricosus TaxID=182803 RepID=A0A4Y2P2Q3_ARAVE|nr:hypothetical protein AVEN_167517-1 [Araneus ventricosus]